MSPRKTEFTKRINVFFTPEQLEQIRDEADRSGLNVSAYVRMVVMTTISEDNILEDIENQPYDSSELFGH